VAAVAAVAAQQVKTTAADPHLTQVQVEITEPTVTEVKVELTPVAVEVVVLKTHHMVTHTQVATPTEHRAVQELLL
jgi:hypothetical protein